VNDLLFIQTEILQSLALPGVKHSSACGLLVGCSPVSGGVLEIIEVGVVVIDLDSLYALGRHASVRLHLVLRWMHDIGYGQVGLEAIYVAIIWLLRFPASAKPRRSEPISVFSLIC